MAHRPHAGMARLGAWIARRPWAVVAAWLLLAWLALGAAADLPRRLDQSGASVPGGEGSEVRRRLDRDFTNPFSDFLVVAMRSERYTLEDPAFRAIVAQVAADLRTRPGVRRVAAPTDPDAPDRLVSADGHTALVLVGQPGQGAAGEGVRVVREAVAPSFQRLRALDAGVKAEVTGAAALSTDVMKRNSADTATAEKRVLLPALVLLVVLFASPVAALLPIVMGVLASTVALGLAAQAARVLPMNSYCQTAAAMIGLAVGIDYALIVVSRYQEARRSGLAMEAAVAEAMGASGWTVVTSGLVVVAALAALIPSGLLEPVSLGVGGALVVAVSIALATTLLPALLAISDRALGFPGPLTRRLHAFRSQGRWQAWAGVVSRRRWPLAGAALLLMVLLAAPSTGFRPGLPDGRWYPSDLEAARGGAILAGMGLEGMNFPLKLIVEAPEGASVLAPQGLAAMHRLSRRMAGDPRVAEVMSPVDLRPGTSLLEYMVFYRDPARTLARHPEVKELFVSRDGHSAYMQVRLQETATLSQAKALVETLRREGLTAPGHRLWVGGAAASNVDLENRLLAYTPFAMGMVFVLSALILFVMFRSVMIPLKAIALNMLTVGAATGAIVLVFQEGFGASLVGVAGPLHSVPSMLPLMIFCLTFGLSMDYEIFMISRVAQERGGPGGEEGAIARGLAATAGLVTAAAAIMAMVFGAFVSVEMVLVKMLGFGLLVAVVLDATVVRMVLAPAALAIAGRWNWWPGDTPSPNRDRQGVAGSPRT